MVIDTSALLAVFFEEPHAAWVRENLKRHKASLRMNTVNLTEALIIIRSRQRHKFDEIRDEIVGSSIRFVAPTLAQAEAAAEARMKFPLNLGDCFAYALAKEESDSILTLDPDFARTDVSVILPPSG